MTIAERALKLLHLPFAEIADGIRVGYDTVKGWSSGRAEPTRANRHALARFLRRHADELLRTADELEGQAAAGAAFSSPGPIGNPVDPTEGWVADQGPGREQLTDAERQDLVEDVERTFSEE